MNLVTNLKNWIRPGAEEAEEDEDMTSAWAQPAGGRSAGTDREVRIRTTTQLRVIVARPRRLEDVPAVADDLKSMMTVILNVQGLDRDTSRRILDTLSGAAYALDASISRIAADTFMILPFNVEMEGELMDALNSSGLLRVDSPF